MHYARYSREFLGAESFRARNKDGQWPAFFQSGLPAAVEMQAEIQRVKGLYDAACTAAGDEEGGDPSLLHRMRDLGWRQTTTVRR